MHSASDPQTLPSPMRQGLRFPQWRSGPSLRGLGWVVCHLKREERVLKSSTQAAAQSLPPTRGMTVALVRVRSTTYVVAVVRRRILRCTRLRRLVTNRLSGAFVGSPVVLLCHDASGRPTYCGDFFAVQQVRTLPDYAMPWRDMVIATSDDGGWSLQPRHELKQAAYDAGTRSCTVLAPASLPIEEKPPAAATPPCGDEPKRKSRSPARPRTKPARTIPVVSSPSAPTAAKTGPSGRKQPRNRLGSSPRPSPLSSSTCTPCETPPPPHRPPCRTTVEVPSSAHSSGNRARNRSPRIQEPVRARELSP